MLLLEAQDMLGLIINLCLLVLLGGFLDDLSSAKLQLLIGLLLEECDVLHHL